MVSTHRKNISQIGSFPQVGVKIKNIWNHHPEKILHNFGSRQSVMFSISTGVGFLGQQSGRGRCWFIPKLETLDRIWSSRNSNKFSITMMDVFVYINAMNTSPLMKKTCHLKIIIWTHPLLIKVQIPGPIIRPNVRIKSCFFDFFQQIHPLGRWQKAVAKFKRQIQPKGKMQWWIIFALYMITWMSQEVSKWLVIGL